MQIPFFSDWAYPIPMYTVSSSIAFGCQRTPCDFAYRLVESPHNTLHGSYEFVERSSINCTATPFSVAYNFIVFTCEISDQGIQSFAEKYFKPEFKEVTDFRFSKKESTVSGAIWSNKSDFINKIYTVGAIGENLTGISFDYQAHYVPPRTYISDVIKPVLERGKQLLFEEVLTAGEKNGKK